MVAGGIGADGERAGARTLSLLAAPLNALLLDKLAQGPRRLVDLRRETGSPPQTTLRARVRELIEIGAVAKRRLHPFPSVREHVLTNGSGAELRFVAATLEAWLAAAPGGGMRLGTEPARSAVKALVDAWSSGVLRAIAERPAAAADLGATAALSAQSLTRRLDALRDAGLAEVAGEGRGEGGSERDGPVYAATDWLRRSAAPLVAAIRWERKHLSILAPALGPIDAESGLLLAVPLLELPPELSGSCRLGVEFADGAERRLVGVTAHVEEGKVVSCVPRMESGPTASATGQPPAWMRVAIEADPDRLELAGDKRLATALLDGLNRALFAPRSRLLVRPNENEGLL